MNVPIKCIGCKKPLSPKGHVAYNKQGRAYVLCPFANCQAINYLPPEPNNSRSNSNPELHELVKQKSKKK